MFDYLKNILQKDNNQQISIEKNEIVDESNDKKIQVATAAVLVEMAKADGDFSEDERRHIIKTLQNTFKLDEVCVKELINLSEKKLEKGLGIYEFTSIINNNFSKSEKLELIEDLWKIIYADDKLDKYEDRLVKLIGAMLNVDHKNIINAKLLVKKRLKLD